MIPDCTVRVAPGEPIGPHLAAGAIVCLAAGRHEGPLTIEQSLTLRGEEGAVLDALAAGPALRIEEKGLKVRVEGLTIVNGYAEGGAGVSLAGWSEVDMVDCRFEEHHSAADGGGGTALALKGRLRLVNCTFAAGAARGADLVVSGAAIAEVDGGQFSSNLLAREGATLDVKGARVKGALDLRGTTTRAPQVTVRGSTIEGGVRNDPRLPAKLTVSP